MWSFSQTWSACPCLFTCLFVVDSQLGLTDVVEEINEKHMAPWGEMCQRSGIQSTPLNPFIDEVINKAFISGEKKDATK